ncbi:hypothetical protein ACLUX0_01505 [Limosilactobacillus mucosae]
MAKQKKKAKLRQKQLHSEALKWIAITTGLQMLDDLIKLIDKIIGKH